MARCCTCFKPVAYPAATVAYRADGLPTHHASQCVDPAHDADVLGRHGMATDFLRRAIKTWRGTTQQASLGMYGVKVPPTLPEAA